MRHQQGVQSLEVVQKFYEIIQEKPKKAAIVRKDLIEFCGNYTLSYHPVVCLTYHDSKTNEKFRHLVRVFKINPIYKLKISINTQ